MYSPDCVRKPEGNRCRRTEGWARAGAEPYRNAATHVRWALLSLVVSLGLASSSCSTASSVQQTRTDGHESPTAASTETSDGPEDSSDDADDRDDTAEIARRTDARTEPANDGKDSPDETDRGEHAEEDPNPPCAEDANCRHARSDSTPLPAGLYLIWPFESTLCYDCTRPSAAVITRVWEEPEAAETALATLKSNSDFTPGSPLPVHTEEVPLDEVNRRGITMILGFFASVDEARSCREKRAEELETKEVRLVEESSRNDLRTTLYPLLHTRLSTLPPSDHYA